MDHEVVKALIEQAADKVDIPRGTYTHATLMPLQEALEEHSKKGEPVISARYLKDLYTKVEKPDSSGANLSYLNRISTYLGYKSFFDFQRQWHQPKKKSIAFLQLNRSVIGAFVVLGIIGLAFAWFQFEKWSQAALIDEQVVVDEVSLRIDKLQMEVQTRHSFAHDSVNYTSYSELEELLQEWSTIQAGYRNYAQLYDGVAWVKGNREIERLLDEELIYNTPWYLKKVKDSVDIYLKRIQMTYSPKENYQFEVALVNQQKPSFTVLKTVKKTNELLEVETKYHNRLLAVVIHYNYPFNSKKKRTFWVYRLPETETYRYALKYDQWKLVEIIPHEN